MRRRKISQAQVERTLNLPDQAYESYDKLVAEGATAEVNVIVVVHVEPAEGKALAVSAVRREGR